MMDGKHGKARCYQQGEDVIEAIEEAIDVCPADCIHKCEPMGAVRLGTR